MKRACITAIAAAALAAALAGCGLGPGSVPTGVHLTVTRGFGAQVLTKTSAPKAGGAETVMSLLLRNDKITTKYGGGFVQSIGGQSGGEAGGDPTDWFYAQHGPSFTTANTTGIFGLTLMDNGNDRMYPGGTTQTCGVYGAPVCYSTVPVFQINESTMTATLTFHQIVPPALYNQFGGNAEVPGPVPESDHIEYDLCGVSVKPPTSSQIFEVTNEQNPQTVWNLKLTGANAYRAYRLPSLYPGVQW